MAKTERNLQNMQLCIGFKLEFNVMPLSKIPKDKREEGALASLKAEGREWATKIVQVGGKARFLYSITRFIKRVIVDLKQKARKVLTRSKC